MSFGQSNAREMDRGKKDKITFTDVAGAKEAKQEPPKFSAPLTPEAPVASTVAVSPALAVITPPEIIPTTTLSLPTTPAAAPAEVGAVVPIAAIAAALLFFLL